MDDAELQLRPARRGDGAVLAALHREAGAYYVGLAPEDFQFPEETGLAEYCDADLEASEGVLALVAEIGGEVVGALSAQLLQPREDGKYQWNPAVAETRLSIEYLVTAEAHQRRGVGTKLVDAAEAWGREHGATVAITDTYIGSPLSRPFWRERMNYRERSVNLSKPL
jgi:GNAT superfamily N-acetyltransferase